MKTVTLLAAAILAWPLASFAQTPQKDSSPHCNTLSGAEKDQCLRDEAAKTDSKAEPGSAPSGGTAPSASPQSGQDRSPRCDSLSGGEKDQCLKDEAAKTDSKGPADSVTGGAGSSAPGGRAQGGD